MNLKAFLFVTTALVAVTVYFAYYLLPALLMYSMLTDTLRALNLEPDPMEFSLPKSPDN